MDSNFDPLCSPLMWLVSFRTLLSREILAELGSGQGGGCLFENCGEWDEPQEKVEETPQAEGMSHRQTYNDV